MEYKFGKIVCPPKRYECTQDGPEKGALETLAEEVKQLREDVRGMRLDAKKCSMKSTKVNTTVQGKAEDIHGGSVPLETLIVLEGSLSGKEYGCAKTMDSIRT